MNEESNDSLPMEYLKNLQSGGSQGSTILRNSKVKTNQLFETKFSLFHFILVTQQEIQLIIISIFLAIITYMNKRFYFLNWA